MPRVVLAVGGGWRESRRSSGGEAGEASEEEEEEEREVVGREHDFLWKEEGFLVWGWEMG